MKILVADDDWLIRFTMISMLNELGDFIITEASNGIEMVQKYQTFKPDLVFVDIQMPLKNGLDAIEACQNVSNGEFVIVSSYSDFEYAKKGIQLGIHEYLVKPLEVQKLSEVLDTVKTKIMSRSKDLNFKFQLSVSNLINYYPSIDVEAAFRKPSEPGMSYLSIITILRGIDKEDMIKDFSDEIDKALNKHGDEIVATNTGFFTNLITSGGQSISVFYAEDEVIDSILKSMNHLVIGGKSRSINANLIYKISSDIYDTASFSSYIDDYTTIVSAYHNFSLIEYDKNKLTHEDELFLFKLDLMIKMIEHRELDEIYNIRNSLYDIKTRSQLTLDFNNVVLFLQAVLQISQFDNFEQIIDEAIHITVKKANSEQGGDRLINTIIHYIECNYMNEISVSEIAELHEITPNYLSSLFHQDTGRKFIDYLTELRMAKASELLIQKPNTTVSDIAIMVGYNSARHFSTLFQKYYKQTPTQYRKN